ncbi:hypothetical protein GCM10007171_36640 [Dickeya fangzhongdai]|nr:hypothetical protein GCM10007171_36640 [Dickeya fangzhongdai]
MLMRQKYGCEFGVWFRSDSVRFGSCRPRFTGMENGCRWAACVISPRSGGISSLREPFHYSGQAL